MLIKRLLNSKKIRGMSLIEMLVAMLLLGFLGMIIMYYSSIIHKSAKKTKEFSTALNYAVKYVEEGKRLLSITDTLTLIDSTVFKSDNAKFVLSYSEASEGTNYGINLTFTKHPTGANKMHGIKLETNITWSGNHNIKLQTVQLVN